MAAGRVPAATTMPRQDGAGAGDRARRRSGRWRRRCWRAAAPRAARPSPPPACARSRTRGGSRRPRRRGRVGVARRPTSAPLRSTASQSPGPPDTSTRSPGSTSVRRRHGRRDDRAGGVAPMPWATSLASTVATVGLELLVTKTIGCPAACSRATASAAPGMGRSASHSTPSRSSDVRTGRSGSIRGIARHGAPLRALPRHPLRHRPRRARRRHRSALRRDRRRRARRSSPARSPYNAVHVDCPVARRDDRRLLRNKAAATFDAWQADGACSSRTRRRSTSTACRSPTRRAATAHHRRRRRPRARTARRGRRPPPRAHHAQGPLRPPRPPAVDGRQPLGGLGAVAGGRAVEAARPGRCGPARLDGPTTTASATSCGASTTPPRPRPSPRRCRRSRWSSPTATTATRRHSPIATSAGQPPAARPDRTTSPSPWSSSWSTTS